MKKIFLIFVLFLLIGSTPALAQENAKDDRFSMTGEELRALCATDKEKCALWIQGVMEGMEFLAIIVRNAEDPPLYCLEGESHRDIANKLQKQFMTDIEMPESKSMLDRSAVLMLTPGINEYMCYRRQKNN